MKQKHKKAALIIYNPQSGKQAGPAEVAAARRLLKAYYPRITAIAWHEQAAWQQELDRGEYELAIAAGGDGTVNRVASYLLGKDISLGVIPIGTFNHFAKYMGLPTALKQACQVISKGKTALIDIGQVNGHIFLNQAVLGIYTDITREKQQKRKEGRNKWLALVIATIRAFIANPAYTVELSYGAKSIKKTISLLLISNSKQLFDRFFLLSPKQPKTIPALQIGIIHWLPRYRFFILILKSIFGRLMYDEYIDSVNLMHITVSGKGKAELGLDGEIIKLEYPLTFSLKPQCLKVIVPAEL